MEKLSVKEIKSKIEIDPAAVGDQGIYTCMVSSVSSTLRSHETLDCPLQANNEYSVMVKNFKTEYYY